MIDLVLEETLIIGLKEVLVEVLVDPLVAG